MRVVRGCLEPPGQLPVSTLTASREQVYRLSPGPAFAMYRPARGCRYRRCRDGSLDRRSRSPDISPAVRSGIDIGPGLGPGSPFFMGTVIKPPLQIAGVGIVGLEHTRLIHVVSGADQKMVTDDNGRHGGEVLQSKLAISLCHLSFPVLALRQTR